MEHKEYIEALQAAGHLLRLDDNGVADEFALDYEYHNGPMCELCHESWCVHCQDTIQPCSAAAIESTCEVVEDKSEPLLLPSKAQSEPTARLFAQVGSTDGLAGSGPTE